MRLDKDENVAPAKKWIARQQLGEDALDERKIGRRIHSPAQYGKAARIEQHAERENLRFAGDIGRHMLALKRVLRFSRGARQRALDKFSLTAFNNAHRALFQTLASEVKAPGLG